MEGEPEDNLVVKAYKLLKKDYPGLLPVDIHMYKHIPAGAGLGGGSSDAACMIKLPNEKSIYLILLYWVLTIEIAVPQLFQG